MLSQTLAADPHPTRIAGEPVSVAVGHSRVDGLDRPFLAVSYRSGKNRGGVVILLGDGQGGYKKSQTIPFTNSQPEGIAIARLSDSGFDDVVIADNKAKVRVIPGRAGGRFARPYGLPIGAKTPTYLAALPDASTAPGRTDRLIVTDFNYEHLTKGSSSVVKVGDANPIASFAAYPGVLGAEKVVAGDFNNDCRTDFAVANMLAKKDSAPKGREGYVTIYQGQEDGFLVKSVLLNSVAGTTPSRNTEAIGLTSGDFDGDKKVDLAIADYRKDGEWGTAVHILTNQSDPGGEVRFSDDMPFDVENGSSLTGVAAINLGDRLLGLAVTSQSNSSVILLHNPGSTNPSEPRSTETISIRDGEPGLPIAYPPVQPAKPGGLDEPGDLIVVSKHFVSIFRNKKNPANAGILASKKR